MEVTMPDNQDTRFALEAYEKLAEAYAAAADTKPHNAYCERPATLSLLPEVEGLRVLDAGCGPGIYAQWLADHGAEVVAFDLSPKMVQFARQRMRDRGHIFQADITRPLDMLAEETFDLVVSALVLDYVRDWEPVFREFARVLRPGGLVVLSAGHPCADFYLRPDAQNYFDVERVSMEWTGFAIPIHMSWYRRPLGAVINPLLAAGFRLERLLEPRPTHEFKEKDPEGYSELMRRPGFLRLRAVRGINNRPAFCFDH
jgi:SAM-dependent methyltransferase